MHKLFGHYKKQRKTICQTPKINPIATGKRDTVQECANLILVTEEMCTYLHI